MIKNAKNLRKKLITFTNLHTFNNSQFSTEYVPLIGSFIMENSSIENGKL